MIIFYSAILYTIQLVVHYSNCLNLIDLPQGREAFTTKWKLVSRAPEMYEPYPRKREIKTYFRRYMLGNDRPGYKLHLKASRRVYEDEKNTNLKNKIAILINQTMSDTEDKLKELDPIKGPHVDKPPYKAGFLLNMVKKSREVINELFNVAIKHRDEWQALEQLKIFEMIVNTNIDNNQYIRQLQEIQGGRNPELPPMPKVLSSIKPAKPTTPISNLRPDTDTDTTPGDTTTSNISNIRPDEDTDTTPDDTTVGITEEH